MPTIFTERSGYPIVVLGPSADLHAGHPRTAPVERALYGHITFIVVHGAGALGTANIRAVATTRDPAALDPVPLEALIRVSAPGSHELGALTALSAAGYTTEPGAHKLIVVEVQQAADNAHPAVALEFTEVVDDPVAGCVLVLATEPRFGCAAPALVV